MLKCLHFSESFLDVSGVTYYVTHFIPRNCILKKWKDFEIQLKIFDYRCCLHMQEDTFLIVTQEIIGIISRGYFKMLRKVYILIYIFLKKSKALKA